jgi:hypothetical protein
LKKIPILLLLSIGATLWFSPFFLDWLRYRDLPSHCAGVFSYSGSVGDESLSGRHCSSGTNITANESGFMISFEVARDGRLVAYGKTNAGVLTSNPCTNGACDLNLGLFRPEAQNAWYCATNGTYQNQNNSLSFTLSNMSKLVTTPAEKEVSATFSGGLEGKLVIDGKEFKNAGLWGRSCDSSMTRCDFELGTETNAVRVHIRTNEDMRSNKEMPIADVFIIEQNGRHPKSLTIRQAKESSGSIITYDGDKLSLSLKGLSEPAACSPDTAGSGSFTASKSDWGL